MVLNLEKKVSVFGCEWVVFEKVSNNENSWE